MREREREREIERRREEERKREGERERTWSTKNSYREMSVIVVWRSVLKSELGLF